MAREAKGMPRLKRLKIHWNKAIVKHTYIVAAKNCACTALSIGDNLVNFEQISSKGRHYGPIGDKQVHLEFYICKNKAYWKIRISSVNQNLY